MKYGNGDIFINYTTLQPSMDSGMFIRLIESEYLSVILRGQMKAGMLNTDPSGGISGSSDLVSGFKNWFVMVLRGADVTAGDIHIHAEDAIVHAAARMSAIPPYKHLHPAMVKVLDLFTRKELDDIFGTSRRIAIEKAIDRRDNEIMSRHSFIQNSGSAVPL